MASFLSGLVGRLFGAGSSGTQSESAAESVEHKGFRIYATPFSEGGQYQTAGRIEKDFDGKTKEHRFIRAEKHPSREDAENFSISKGKQIVDEQGDRIFKS